MESRDQRRGENCHISLNSGQAYTSCQCSEMVSKRCVAKNENGSKLTKAGEILASAGDDGNVLLWVPSDSATHQAAFGEDNTDDLEKWRVKTMCRSSNGSEIYDLAWSPDGSFFITGSMDNVARIYNATNGNFTPSLTQHN